MKRSLMAIVKPVQMLLAQAISATTTLSGVDTKGFNSLALLFSVGNFAFTTTDKLTITIEHSDDNSSWSLCGADDLYGADTPASGIFKVLDSGTEDESVFICDYLGSKRYVRAVITEGGTVSVIMAVSALLGHSDARPMR